MVIQLILIIFFAFVILRVIGRYKKQELGLGITIAWSMFWLAGAAVVLLPNSTMYVAHWLGVGRGVDAVVYLSIAVIFFLIFWLMVKVEKLSQAVTKLTRELAIKESVNERH